MSADQIQVTETEGGKLLSCPEYFDISVAAEFQKTLLALLEEKPGSVIFDVSNVEIFDTSIGQISCAFMQNAEKDGIQVEWKNPSEAVCQSAKLLGLSEIMRL